MKTKSHGLEPKENGSMNQLNGNECNARVAKAYQALFESFNTLLRCNAPELTFEELIEAMVVIGFMPGSKTKDELRMLYDIHCSITPSNC